MTEKAIWLVVRHEDGDSDSKDVKISSESNNLLSYGEDRKVLVKSICQQLGLIYSEDKVYKFRNSRGSLVAIYRNMSPNSITSPFILEVQDVQSTAKSNQKRVVLPGYSKACQQKFNSMSNRVTRLENMIPHLPILRNEKLTNEMKDVEQRLLFLNERMKEAESQEWKGMFKKYPLW